MVLLLAAALFFFGTFWLIRFGLLSQFYNTREFLDGRYGTYLESMAFQKALTDDLENMAVLSNADKEKAAKDPKLHQRVEEARVNLAQRTNLKYYIVSADGTVYTNLEKKPGASTLSNYLVNGTVHKGRANLNGIVTESNLSAYTVDLAESVGDVRYYITLGSNRLDEVKPELHGDAYFEAYEKFQHYQHPSIIRTVWLFLGAYVLALMGLVLWLNMVGWKPEEEKPVLLSTDYLPTDIHLVLYMGLLAALVAPSTAGLVAFGNRLTPMELPLGLYPWAIAAVATVVFLLTAEWLASIVRIKRFGWGWWKRTLIYRIYHYIARQFFYRPRRFRWTVGALLVLYMVVNLGLTLATVYIGAPKPNSVFIAIMVAFNALCLAFLLKYARILDTIIDASSRHESADLSGDAQVPESLRILNENLTATFKERQDAVEKAVRDEVLRTELITNVSHDLKTPLTSIITYVGILNKVEPADPSFQNYLDILGQQANKLKILIEDLIEVSKISSGNIELDQVKLNLNELSAQAVGEYTMEMQDTGGNEIITTEGGAFTAASAGAAPAGTSSAAPVYIFADGMKTYRILANLLSNAKKYSAPGTRVYIDLYQDCQYGYFSIKNVSAEALNISPDELTERFTRGNRSRSDGNGNGLGLSIARDLCQLQGGFLDISIDGDLFKAVVALPLASAADPAAPTGSADLVGSADAHPAPQA